MTNDSAGDARDSNAFYSLGSNTVLCSLSLFLWGKSNYEDSMLNLVD